MLDMHVGPTEHTYVRDAQDTCWRVQQKSHPCFVEVNAIPPHLRYCIQAVGSGLMLLYRIAAERGAPLISHVRI